MLFSKITLLSIVALAAAAPNPLADAEPAALEARTWGYNWNNNICHCTCDHNGNYKRHLETRTFGILTKLLCHKQCKRECDDYYDEHYKQCLDQAKYDYEHCCAQCNKHKREAEPLANPTNNNNNNCNNQCKTTYENAKHHCKAQWSH